MANYGVGTRYRNQDFEDTRVNTDHPLSAFFKKVKYGEETPTWYWVVCGSSLMCFIFPQLIIAYILLAWISILMYFDRGKVLTELPIRLPIQANVPDGSNAFFGRTRVTEQNLKSFKPTGSILFGQELETRQEVWISDDDILTHMMIIGTTKSGKTVFILQLMLHALIKNSGFLYVDAKGDIETLKHICQQLRRFGREDDLLVVSFLPYEKPEFGDMTKPTNTMNINSTGTATMLSEVHVQMLDGEDDMWKGRTIAFTIALMRALVCARDLKLISLSSSTILKLTELRELEKFVWDTCQKSTNASLRLASNSLADYLKNIPAYDKTKFDAGKPQEGTTLDQHGFVTMQLLRALNDMAYNYGHIFGQESSDLDMSDAVFRRRNVVFSLPALGRSPSTLSMLGRIIVANIKQMASLVLGNTLEGSIRLNVEARASNARNIYLIMFDEVGYFMTEGMSIMPAQFRAFKLATVFSGQTFSNLKKANENEAEEIWNNCNIKIIGRFVGDDTSADFQKVQGLAGEQEVFRANSFTRKTHDVWGTYYRRNEHTEARFEKRITLKSLKTQSNGQFTVIVTKDATKNKDNGEIVVAKTQMFYPIPEKSSGFVFVNEFVYFDNTELKMGSKTLRDNPDPNGGGGHYQELQEQGWHAWLALTSASNAFYANKEVKDNLANGNAEQELTRSEKLTDLVVGLTSEFQANEMFNHITDKPFILHQYLSQKMSKNIIASNTMRNDLKGAETNPLELPLMENFKDNTKDMLRNTTRLLLESKGFKSKMLDYAFDDNHDYADIGRFRDDTTLTQEIERLKPQSIELDEQKFCEMVKKQVEQDQQGYADLLYNAHLIATTPMGQTPSQNQV